MHTYIIIHAYVHIDYREVLVRKYVVSATASVCAVQFVQLRHCHAGQARPPVGIQSWEFPGRYYSTLTSRILVIKIPK